MHSGICKRPTVDNIAGSGLNIPNVHHLKKLNCRVGENGLRDTFTCITSDCLPRVTNVKKLLDEVELCLR